MDPDRMTATAAYASGLFEGEGTLCVSKTRISKDGSTRYRQLRLSMTDREPLDRWCECVGRGHVLGPYRGRRAEYKDYYVVCLGRHEDITFAVHMMWDWLSPRRRAQAKDVLGDDLYYSNRAGQR
jgi:hypothetical protein